jgi:multicomponent Na+:H+ antiporter subunit B
VRGHNSPGGGFIAGLVFTGAIALFVLSGGTTRARKLMIFRPLHIANTGLLVALLSGLSAIIQGSPFLSGLWLERSIPILGKVGTPVLFDSGVFLVVVGISTAIIFALVEND